ncbi:unnamed protein product [Trypanosoma congolense IL3000]|uniref:WGS project CAEQ00000000 data, annotated contig 2108 n=1 Tax=Trypanosoma congolense (strain IL3000) TaxID=1068625 RepID=F9WBI3_TRYCI|nr:unnamed protein product [Trypanosoma congolense IL3000]
MQQMLGRLNDNTIKDIRYLVGDGIITLCDWALRGASTLLAWTPRPILDEAVRVARKHPRSPITSGSMSVQSGNEASDKLTPQVAGTPSTQRQPGGTEDREVREVVWKAFKSFEGACLVDFLTQECGKTHGACNPNVAPAAFLEDPSHYIKNDAGRKEAVEKLPGKLHHMKGCIFRDVPFLRAIGITTRGYWVHRLCYREMLTPITNCIL